MQDKIILLTGGTAGIGKATAEGLAKMGAHVVITGRNREKAIMTVAELKAISKNNKIDYLIADSSSQAEVRRLADEFKGKYPHLDVLINNAGGVFSKRQMTVDGIEYTFGFNHLAPFLLTNLLLDSLKAADSARVVTLSSGAAGGGKVEFDNLHGEKKYSAFGAYSNSKLENILFSNELARRLSGTGITSNSLHPGFVASNFGKNNSALMTVALTMMRPFAINTEKGAATSIYVASSDEIKGVTGQFFSKSARAEPPSIVANDSALARQLWETSEKLTGLTVTA